MLIDIEKVIIKDRIRKDYGDIEELAQDIKENGLINPPVVTPDYVLIAGERRLRALKALGKKDIEVRVMTVDTAEQALNMEISENECRKDFSKTERIDYARRLERIESIKAEKNLHLSQGQGVKGVQNFAQVKTRDKVAETTGIGSGEQYRKEKAIVDNKPLFTEEEFREWDEGRLSTNKAFQRMKERLRKLEAKVDELEGQEPEVIEKEVPPADYEETKRKLESAIYTAKRAEDDFSKMRDRNKELSSQVESLQSIIGEDKRLRQVEEDMIFFTNATNDYIRRYGGHVWVFDEFDRAREETRADFIKAIRALDSFCQRILQNLDLEGGGLNGATENG